MEHYEIFNGRQYILTVSPSLNPSRVLDEERSRLRNPRLRLVQVKDGKRTEVIAPANPTPIDLEEEEQNFEEYT
jgi:hypothetical protein